MIGEWRIGKNVEGSGRCLILRYYLRIPAGAKDFSSSFCVQTGSGAHPPSCPMGTGGPFAGGKSAWRWPLTPI
jgi:hypothetical protein